MCLSPWKRLQLKELVESSHNAMGLSQQSINLPESDGIAWLAGQYLRISCELLFIMPQPIETIALKFIAK